MIRPALRLFSVPLPPWFRTISSPPIYLINIKVSLKIMEVPRIQIDIQKSSILQTIICAK